MQQRRSLFVLLGDLTKPGLHRLWFASVFQHSVWAWWLWAELSGDRIPVGARFCTLVQTGPGAHPASCRMGTGSFPGVKYGRGATMTPQAFSCRRQERVDIYLYSPYGPYGLYRTSVPVQYSYTSTPPMGRTACTEPQCLYSIAITLIPLWSVRPVQSLCACTVQLYIYSPCGPYGLYRASVPVQYSYTSTPPMVRTDCTEPQCLYQG